MRAAADFGDQRPVARCRISYAVTAPGIGREYPKDRAARAGASCAFKVRMKPRRLRKAFVTIWTHAEFAKHQRLVDRKGSRGAILDELAQRLRRVDKAVQIVARIVVHVAVIDLRQRVIGKPFTALGRRAIAPVTRRD